MNHSVNEVAPPILPGGIVAGRFQVERVIGSGGMGVVVAARHLALNKRVALKFLRSDSISERDALRRFVREAHATAQLQSEHVARVMDAEVIDPELAFIAMEYLRGRDLAQVIEQDGALPIDLAVDYILQACEAIAEAHALDIIHRDIKPSNLFLTRGPDGAPFIKVLDFGLSKVGWAGVAVTSKNRVLGSPHFMSPEQMRASCDVDARSDIWSLGAVLFTLLAGQCPFRGDFRMEVCAAVLSGDVVDLRNARPEVSKELAAVVMRCLAPEPEDRFLTVSQFAEAICPFAPKTGAYRVARVVSVAKNAEASPISAQISGGLSSFHYSRSQAFTSAKHLSQALGAQALSSSTFVEKALPEDGHSKRSLRVLAAVVGLALGAAWLGWCAADWWRSSAHATHPETEVPRASAVGLPPAPVSASPSVTVRQSGEP